MDLECQQQARKRAIQIARLGVKPLRKTWGRVPVRILQRELATMPQKSRRYIQSERIGTQGSEVNELGLYNDIYRVYEWNENEKLYVYFSGPYATEENALEKIKELRN